MKYLILYNEGGIYSDMKMVCLESFDKIFPKSLKWYSAIDCNPARMANGFIVSVKEHPILLNTIQKIKKNFWDKDIGIDNLFPTGPTTFEYGFETYFNNCMKYHHKNENYIKTEFDFLSIKKEVSLLNEEIVKENDLNKKNSLITKKSILNNIYYDKKKKMYSYLQEKESFILGQHKKTEDNILYFYDNKGNKIIKTKYTNNGKEFSAGEWDKFPQIKGNNYNILWMRNQIYSDSKYPLYYDKRFSIFFLFSLLTVYLSITNKEIKYVKKKNRKRYQNILNDIIFVKSTLRNLKSRLKKYKKNI